MRLAFPEEIRRVPIDHPDQAVARLTEILGQVRDGAAADLEPIAVEVVETTLRAGAFLLAVVTPPAAAPAILTGVVLAVPPAWDRDTAESLRDALEDVGGPDVRETAALATGLGPAVLVQQVPGVEQARERRALTVRLQAFVPEPDSGRMLLLTLACPSVHGWAAHQELFAALVASADQVREESFEEHTYRV
ncbi:hypothetical protein [Actinophytocola sediminis]